MVGHGGGPRGWPKVRVQDCFTLSLTALLRDKTLVPGARTSGTWRWWRPGQTDYTVIVYRADLTDPAAAWLWLGYQRGGEPVAQRIPLLITRLPSGGVRWWLSCPLKDHDDGRPRLAMKLYLPPCARLFGSRAAHDLTYASCQESGKYRRFQQRIAARLGLEESLVRRSMRGPRTT